LTSSHPDLIYEHFVENFYEKVFISMLITLHLFINQSYDQNVDKL